MNKALLPIVDRADRALDELIGALSKVTVTDGPDKERSIAFKLQVVREVSTVRSALAELKRAADAPVNPTAAARFAAIEPDLKRFGYGLSVEPDGKTVSGLRAGTHGPVEVRFEDVAGAERLLRFLRQKEAGTVDMAV